MRSRQVSATDLALLGAVLREQHEAWITGKRYLDLAVLGDDTASSGSGNVGGDGSGLGCLTARGARERFYTPIRT